MTMVKTVILSQDDMTIPQLLDMPKCLRDRAQCNARLALLRSPEMVRLTEFVESLRLKASEDGVPFFDPLDGGTRAECLFLLEAPGPKAVCSGFVSRNNPDETAKNWFELNLAAGIDRRRTVIWNIVPWYIGCKGSIRPATTADIERGLPYLRDVIGLLPALRVVVLVGRKASKARRSLEDWVPQARVLQLPHPSPMFINRRLQNRDLVLQGLQQVRQVLDGTSQ